MVVAFEKDYLKELYEKGTVATNSTASNRL